jgi:hypothetical protein
LLEAGGFAAFAPVFALWKKNLNCAGKKPLTAKNAKKLRKVREETPGKYAPCLDLLSI